MAEHEHHCPFLNRPDERCSQHFHLDDLQHAFQYCFDRFESCPVYLDRWVERRGGPPPSEMKYRDHAREVDRHILVQISIPARHACRPREAQPA